MEDSLVQLIIAVSGLVSAVSGIVVYALGRMHVSGKVADVAKSLEQTDEWVAEHEVQLKTGIKVAEDLAPEAKALIDANKEKIDALTKEIEAKTASLNELKKVLPPAS